MEQDQKTNKPQHQHDCTRCKFLGSIDTADIYVCTSEKANCYILRYSSEGSDYFSKSDFSNRELNKIMAEIGGGDEKYYLRMTAIHLCATGITNLMKG